MMSGAEQRVYYIDITHASSCMGFFVPFFSSFILHPDGGGSTHVLSSNLFNPGMKRALHPNAYTIIKEE
ncbi:hypothetical protein DMO16_03015 [Fictibacillus sp. S7]|nr:hypothetical protein DMO16_03015 [Fictibacillus sp. S7]